MKREVPHIRISAGTVREPQTPIGAAKRLRAETTMAWGWIAQRLKTSAPGYLANCLRSQTQ